jgi:hypothetical protein
MGPDVTIEMMTTGGRCATDSLAVVPARWWTVPQNDFWEGTMVPRRKFLHLALGAAALPAVSRFAWAQAYPTRPVRVIVPFGAGGPTDVFARLIAQKLSQQAGKQFYVENIVGGGGNVGTRQAARAAPDGHTMLFTVGAHRRLPLSQVTPRSASICYRLPCH